MGGKVGPRGRAGSQGGGVGAWEAWRALDERGVGLGCMGGTGAAPQRGPWKVKRKRGNQGWGLEAVLTHSQMNDTTTNPFIEIKGRQQKIASKRMWQSNECTGILFQ